MTEQPAAPIELVLVDFDDTLVDTGPRFQNARRALLALMSEAGFTEDAARGMLFDRVDPDMRRQYGLGPKRMEPAFMETYRRLCAERALEPDPEVLRRAGDLGRGCYGTAPAFEGALQALQRLVDAYPTVVYTQSGDLEYQLSCVRGAGVLEIVREDRVHVLEHKDENVLAETLRGHGVEPSRAWMIGNSMRSDVNPALRVGANAILVETADPWEYDVVEPHSTEFLTVRSFPEAVDLLLQRGGRE